MKQVELYAKVRQAVRIGGVERTGGSAAFRIDPRTISKMLKSSLSPGYQRS
jgi:hypothetical protein